jgi:3-dehydroquinate dehydratase-2
MPSHVLVLNGPNLNLLGTREPGVYGHTTLADIGRMVAAEAEKLDLTTDFRQSNHEGELVDWIQQARDAVGAILINAGAYTHTSVAIHDALRAYGGPVWEVHLSNIYKREPFRQHSYISPLAEGVICGLGPEGYLAALRAAAAYLSKL